jgi:hypothetical protein
MIRLPEFTNVPNVQFLIFHQLSSLGRAAVEDEECLKVIRHDNVSR